MLEQRVYITQRGGERFLDELISMSTRLSYPGESSLAGTGSLAHLSSGSDTFGELFGENVAILKGKVVQVWLLLSKKNMTLMIRNFES